MKREKLVISLIVMVVLTLVLTMSVFATGEPKTIQITPNSNSASTNTGTTISQGNSSVSDDTEVGQPANNSSTISPAVNNSSRTNSAGTSSSYRNMASNASSESDTLPYTGSSYGMVFVIVVLVVSAVYAYKKVSDYNM